VNDACVHQPRALDPRDAESNAFQEGLLGLAALCRELDALVARLPQSDGSPPDIPTGSEFLHVLLGLLSLRKTFGLTLDALLQGGKQVGTPERGAAASAWNRGHLR
jgi:hypothetical protein